MTDHIIVRNVDRGEPSMIAGLASAGVATVHEAYGQRGLLDPNIRPIQSGATIAGSAVTVLCAPGDNIMIHAAVEVVQPGDVLVVATTSPSTGGMFGDLLATTVQEKGGIALVIDAGVRDVAEIRSMGFGVWSKAIHAQGPVKETPGSVNIPVLCAGVTIHPGDVVVADDDGVVVVALDALEATLDAATTRLEQEVVVRERLRSGELGLDLYGLRERLDGLGVIWQDRPS